MTITSCTMNPNPVNTSQTVTLSGTSGQVHGASTSDLIKVVIGFRNGSGTWVGGEPVVVSSTVPGQSFQPWSGSSAGISAPSSAGTYYVWVRAVPTVDNATAIQNFKDATPTSPDEVRDDRWDTALTVNPEKVPPEISLGIPEPNSIQVARDTVIQVRITDSGSGR